MDREKLFTKMITQIGKGHQEEYEDLAREIDLREEMQLVPEYQDILNSIKDNPLEEKEIADIIEKASKGEISQFEIAAHVLGGKFNDAENMEQVALLIAKVTSKVLDYRDDKGIVKKTKNFENYEPMKPVDRMKYETLHIDFDKLSEKDSETKRKEIDSFVSEKTKIDVNTLSNWEKGLLNEILTQEAKGISNIFLGKK